MKTDIARKREEALQAFRESQRGAYGVNPARVFLEGWDARQAVEDAERPKWYSVEGAQRIGTVEALRRSGPIV